MQFTKRSLLLQHIQQHIENDDKVPQYTIDRLNREISEIGDDCG